MEGSSIQKLENDKIKNAYIYGIERYPNSIKAVYKSIGSLLCEGKISLIRKESVLGCNDEVILLENVSWPDFIGSFHEFGERKRREKKKREKEKIWCLIVILSEDGMINIKGIGE